MILLDLTHKLYIDTKKYCCVISCVLIPGQVISLKGKTVDKDRTKANNGLKTFTEIRLCKIKMENHATFTLFKNCKRYFQVHFDPGINGCAWNISNTWKNYLMEQEKLYKHRFSKKSRQGIINLLAYLQTSCFQSY